MTNIRDINELVVVGIGASAGGLEAIKDLLARLPMNTGMAFVIIQHLDPNHESFAVEIFSRSTEMAVQQISHGTKLQPNNVYLNPPGQDVFLDHKMLCISPRSNRHGQQMQIDEFFQSLAAEFQANTIGIILSGSGHDGANGIRTLKAAGGITFAQDPTTAKFSNMPLAAIATGLVDFVLSPTSMASELTRIASELPQRRLSISINEADQAKQNQTLAKIFTALRTATNVDFSHYKKNTINRRIERRMLVHKIDNLAKYLTYLELHKEEVKALFADILIHVTSFFRDPEVFTKLQTIVLPKYIKQRVSKRPFRIWVPGCSTGQEAYSLAMTFIESQPADEAPIPLSIFATDISEQALQEARAGIFSDSIVEQVSRERLNRFFEKLEGGGYRVSKLLRETCVFSRHDVTRDAPFAKLDLISCRNLLIYFDAEFQKQVIPILHYALNPNGLLLLGKSETIGSFSELFKLRDKNNKIYTKINVNTPFKARFQWSGLSNNYLPYSINQSTGSNDQADVSRELERIVSTQFAPPSVVINHAFEIIQIRGRTSPFVELAPGNPTFNLFRLAHPELVAELQNAIKTSEKKNSTVIKNGLTVFDHGKNITVNIRVVPLLTSSNDKNHYFSIFFITPEITSNIADNVSIVSKSNLATARQLSSRNDKRYAELEQKLIINQEYQKSIIEEYETSQEELISSNEEMQSTNEELQSTNEELETAKEELQSVNEELSTVNDEIQSRNVEIASINADLLNLLYSVEIAMVMVDSNGRIRRFTPKASKLLNIIPADIGRPIGNIKPAIKLAALNDLIEGVIESMNISIVDCQDEKQHWYQIQVRPYRTADNRINGAVIAILDIDALKKHAEELAVSAKQLKAAHDNISAIISAQPIPLLVVDGFNQITLVNNTFCEQFQIAMDDAEGRNFLKICAGQWNIPELTSLVADVLEQGIKFNELEVRINLPGIGSRTIMVSGRRVKLIGNDIITALLIFEDVTERLAMIYNLAHAEEKYRNFLENAHDGILIINQKGVIDFVNFECEKIFGYPKAEIINQPIEKFIPGFLEYFHQQHSKTHFLVSDRVLVNGALALLGQRRDGSSFSAEVTIDAMGAYGEKFVTAVVHDISDRQKVEHQRTMLESEQRTNIVKDEFLSMISHELRTPLANILSWIQLLRSGRADSGKMEYGLEVLERNAREQERLIDDLLDVSRIQSGKLNLVIVTLVPEKIIADAIESTRILAEAKSITFETHIDPSIKQIKADPVRLQQILWNLLTNAIKFSNSNSQVWISFERVKSGEEQHLEIRIRDQGIGIEPDFMPVIFERLTQAERGGARSYRGLGLGLAIVRNLVELHHWSITAHSPGYNQGSTFIITIPLKDWQESTPKVKTHELNLKGLKVLLVEDEADSREVMGIALQSFGAEVQLAESVAQCMAMMSQFKPDILVSDIAMPGEDGYSLISKLRLNKSESSKIPALALTSYAKPKDIERCLQAGYQSHLAKPVDINILASTIAGLVSKKSKS